MTFTHFSGAGSRFRRTARKATAFAAFLSVVGAAGVFLPTAAHAGPTYAIVDLDKVYQESKEKANKDVDLKAFAQSLQTAYQGQQQAIMLSPEQQRTLGKLLVKPAPTASDQDTIKKLQESSKSDLDRLNALQDKQTKGTALTDQEKLDLQTLSAQARAGQQTLSDINQAYQQEWDQSNQEAREEINAKIKEAVGVVAQKQGIQVVFTSQAAVYAATDITKDVIVAVNK